MVSYLYFRWADSYETYVLTHGEYGELWGWILYQALPALLVVGFGVTIILWILS